MSFFESILYGLVSGLTEFLPVSSQGHQALMIHVFGLDTREPVRDLFVHIGILIALLSACKTMFTHFQREQTLMNRRRRRGTERRGAYEVQLIKTAVFPLMVGLLCYLATKKLELDLVAIAILYIINGVVLTVPEYIRHGNKDARFMTGWDGIMIGAFGVASAFPGISRIGAMNFYSMSRGVDRSNSLNWAFMLSVPVILLFMAFDVVNLFILPLGTVTFLTILMYLVSAVAAFFGGYFGILIMRYLAVHTGFAGFAYYSWGVAMFSFVLYLIA